MIKTILTLLLSIAILSKSNNLLAQEKSLTYFANAKEFAKKDSLKLALIDLDSAIKLSPNFSDLYEFKGSIYERTREYRKGIGQYSLAILHSPNKAKPYIHRARLHYQLKDHRNYILNDVNQAIRIEPNNADLHELKSFYYAHTLDPSSLRPDYENAILSISKAIELAPKTPQLFYKRSSYKLKNKQILTALLDINKAIELNDKIDIYYHQRAIVRFIMSDFRSSLNDINLAIQYNSNSIIYYQFRGNVFYNLKKYDRSYQDYSVAINLIFTELKKSKSKIAPQSKINLNLRQTLLLRGMASVQGNKPYDGCEDFNKALRMGESKASNYISQYCD